MYNLQATNNNPQEQKDFQLRINLWILLSLRPSNSPAMYM